MIKRFIILPLFFIIIFFACDGKSKDAARSAAEKKQSKEDTSGIIPGITLSADSTKARVGDIINLTLEYYLPAGNTPLPDGALSGLEDITVVSKKQDKNKIYLSVLIDKPASFDIKPISFSFKDSKGVLSIIRTDALRIEVLSNLGEKPVEAQLKPIMDIIPTFPFWLRALPWAMGALLLAAAAFGFFWWKKRRREDIEARQNIIPPHVFAIQEIEKLCAMNLFDKGEYKEFYFRFSEILRQYIEKIRGFPAAEFTTEEIGRRMKDDADRRILPVLRDADLVKFADVVPLRAKNEEDVKAALAYIKASAPIEEPTPSAAKRGHFTPSPDGSGPSAFAVPRGGFARGATSGKRLRLRELIGKRQEEKKRH